MTKPGPKKRSLEERLQRHRVVRDGCWGWTACKNPAGYGNIRDGSKTYLAHRAAYLVAHGELPDGCVVMHTCDNPECTNPDHLVLGTHGDNVADKVRKGRQHRDLTNPQTRVPEVVVRAEIPSMRARGLSWGAIGKHFGVGRDAMRQRCAKLGMAL
jgi:hypothetical protein